MKLLLIVIFISISAVASDKTYNRGEMLFFSKGCSSCHGASAEGSTTYPRLANKKEAFLMKKLRDFKTGKADTVSRQMMAQFVQKLTIEDMKDLSYFLSHHKAEEHEDVADELLGGFGS